MMEGNRNAHRFAAVDVRARYDYRLCLRLLIGLLTLLLFA